MEQYNTAKFILSEESTVISNYISLTEFINFKADYDLKITELVKKMEQTNDRLDEFKAAITRSYVEIEHKIENLKAVLNSTNIFRFRKRKLLKKQIKDLTYKFNIFENITGLFYYLDLKEL